MGGADANDGGGRGARFGRRGLLAVSAIAVGVLGMALLSGCGQESARIDEDSSAAPLATNSTSEVAAVGSKHTITVLGKATVTIAPDEAVLTLGVENDGADPAKALDTNSKNTQKLVDRLKAEGIGAPSIQTANVTVYPVRTYDPQSGKETLTGYRAQNSVTVTLSDALKVGKVLAAAVEAGATTVTGPEWRLSKDSGGVTDALKKAVADARTKAQAVAEAQGVRLGTVVMMSEGGVDVPVVPVYSGMADSALGGSKVAEPPVSPGTLDVTATITVTYEMSQ